MSLPENSIAVIRADEDETGHRVHYIYAPTIRTFTNGVVEACMDGEIGRAFDFALGFAAAVNAMAHDTVDWAKPVDTVKHALAEVEDVSNARATVTDTLKAYCEMVRV